MSRQLKKNERCPLHNSYTCSCHGVSSIKPAIRVFVNQGDGSTREICNTQELTRRKKLLMSVPANLFCFYCKKAFDDYSQIDLAHKFPKGMGGGFRDDSFQNLTLACRSCNHENGSKRPA